MQLTTIEISKENLTFSSAHFTLFSATDREDLHGHTFRVSLEATAAIQSNGLTFDYNILKVALKRLCDELDEKVLMPTKSPYLKIESDNNYTYILFASERIPFLERDLKLLPIRNITVEELAHYMVDRLLEQEEIRDQSLMKLVLKCASGSGQWANAEWTATN